MSRIQLKIISFNVGQYIDVVRILGIIHCNLSKKWSNSGHTAIHYPTFGVGRYAPLYGINYYATDMY